MMYSQGEEEKYILEACADIEHGQFLDIGAWHPVTFSNTRALFELGWRGVLVEPSPGPLLNLLKEYGTSDRAWVIAAAVASEHKTVRLYVSADAVSTTVAPNYERWKTIANYVGTLIVPTVTVAELCSQYGAFDMVSIDAEGMSVELLRELLKTEMRPRCIVVEHDGRMMETAAVAQPAYRRVYVNENNEVWVLK